MLQPVPLYYCRKPAGLIVLFAQKDGNAEQAESVILQKDPAA